MMRCAVTVSLVPEVRGGPFVYWDDARAAALSARQLGFDGIEVFPPTAETLAQIDLRKILADTGLSLAAVGTGAGWVKHRLALTHPNADNRQKARDFIRSIIDAAGSLGAPAIIGSMQGRHSGEWLPPAEALGLLSDSLNELGLHAAQYGVPLLYEPLNRYETNLFTLLGKATPFVRSLKTSNVQLLADLFHMHIEEDSTPAALRAAGKSIGHVHFVDTNRKPAGLGQMNYVLIADALRSIGYDKFLSAEAFSFPDPESAARRTISTFRTYFCS